MNTGNPVLNNTALQTWVQDRGSESQVMTVSGAVNKSLVLIGLVTGTALFCYTYAAQNPQYVGPMIMGGAISGLVTGLIISFFIGSAPVLAPVYALCEGVFLGGLSCVLESRYPGIAIQAFAGTAGVALTMLMTYKMGIIRATAGFRAGVIAATGGICLMYLISLVGRMFFGWDMGLYAATPLGIGISLVCIVVAALNLILDFDFIQSASQYSVPKKYEWVAAYGLTVTLVWLYIEILRFLSKLNSRD